MKTKTAAKDGASSWLISYQSIIEISFKILDGSGERFIRGF
jgi:hypothetical protein